MLKCSNSILLTMYAQLQEFPFVRYRAVKDDDEPKFRDLVCKKLAASVWDTISTYKSTIPNFPKNETCELLILDRSIDQVRHIFPYELPLLFKSFI